MRTSHSELDQLQQAVRVLWSAFGRKADTDTCAVWAKSLRPYEGPVLYRVFREAAEAESLPNLGEVLGKIRALKKAADGAPSILLTDEQRAKADKVAVLSMLWLHYAKGWSFESFHGTIFERNFGKDPVTALKAAAAIYDKDTVLRWMQDQETKAKREDDQSRAIGGAR